MPLSFFTKELCQEKGMTYNVYFQFLQVLSKMN